MLRACAHIEDRAVGQRERLLIALDFECGTGIDDGHCRIGVIPLNAVDTVERKDVLVAVERIQIVARLIGDQTVLDAVVEAGIDVRARIGQRGVAFAVDKIEQGKDRRQQNACGNAEDRKPRNGHSTDHQLTVRTLAQVFPYAVPKALHAVNSPKGYRFGARTVIAPGSTRKVTGVPSMRSPSTSMRETGSHTTETSVVLR